MKDVEAWFADYRVVLRELNIKNKRNIINFDEAAFRVGYMKGHEILVPTDVKEHYSRVRIEAHPFGYPHTPLGYPHTPSGYPHTQP